MKKLVRFESVCAYYLVAFTVSVLLISLIASVTQGWAIVLISTVPVVIIALLSGAVAAIFFDRFWPSA